MAAGTYMSSLASITNLDLNKYSPLLDKIVADLTDTFIKTEYFSGWGLNFTPTIETSSEYQEHEIFLITTSVVLRGLKDISKHSNQNQNLLKGINDLKETAYKGIAAWNKTDHIYHYSSSKKPILNAHMHLLETLYDDPVLSFSKELLASTKKFCDLHFNSELGFRYAPNNHTYDLSHIIFVLSAYKKYFDFDINLEKPILSKYFLEDKLITYTENKVKVFNPFKISIFNNVNYINHDARLWDYGLLLWFIASTKADFSLSELRSISERLIQQVHNNKLKKPFSRERAFYFMGLIKMYKKIFDQDIRFL